jgi:hypothetical protein
MSCLLSSRFGRKANGSMGLPVLLDYAPRLGFVWASFLLLLDSRLRFCLSPPTFLASCWSIMHFFLPDRFGLYFLYISFISLLLVGAFFFSFLFFFLRHCLKQIKPLFGSIVQTEACKNSVFLKKINFLYFFLF